MNRVDQRPIMKYILGVFGLIVLITTLIYSNYLADKLREGEERYIRIFEIAYRDFIENSVNLDADVSLQDTVIMSFKLPIIVEDDLGQLSGNNWSKGKNFDQEYLKYKKEEFLKSGKKAIIGHGYMSSIYFFNSRLLNYINYFPLIQLLLVSSFIILGYYVFNSSRKAEQNKVWAGMAKETAHQLGTPISAILAWIEHLKMEKDKSENQSIIIDELSKDVDRLNLIADRFSKIGSVPKLSTTNIVDELNKCKSYMDTRSSKGVQFEFPKQGDYRAKINPPLFDWVIENILKNSLDAMDGYGVIQAKVFSDNNHVIIDIKDTGKGIPTSKISKIFRPGYTTKSRGWGLGLSLAKRIIEDYHKGKIGVKSSKIGHGTTISIKLPITKIP